MKFQIKHFWCGVGVFFIGTIVIAILCFLFLVETLGAGPMNKPPDGKILGPLILVWFGPGLAAQKLVDHVYFGGPMPPEGRPSDLGYGGERGERQKEISRIYEAARKRRRPAYIATWVINPIFWGSMFMLVGALRKKQ